MGLVEIVCFIIMKAKIKIWPGYGQHSSPNEVSHHLTMILLLPWTQIDFWGKWWRVRLQSQVHGGVLPVTWLRTRKWSTKKADDSQMTASQYEYAPYRSKRSTRFSQVSSVNLISLMKRNRNRTREKEKTKEKRRNRERKRVEKRHIGLRWALSISGGHQGWGGTLGELPKLVSNGSSSCGHPVPLKGLQ